MRRFGRKTAQRAGLLLLAGVWFFALFAAPIQAAEPDAPRLRRIPGVDQALRVRYDFDYQDLDGVMAQFLKENGLTEKNCSVSYELSDGTLYYGLAEDVFRVAASTYKLPLNMYYYDLEREGKIAPDAKIRGVKLADIHRRSLVYSDNDVSHALQRYLGSYKHYRELMTKFCRQKYPEIYYRDNVINSAYMIRVLERLDANRTDYRELIGYMKQAQPGEYFRDNALDVEIAHKFGTYGGAVNDVGIVETSVPFYLAVYTQGVKNAGKVLGKLCAVLTAYTEYTLWQRQEAERKVIPDRLIVPQDGTAER